MKKIDPQKICDFLTRYFTTNKMLAFILLLLGLVDGLTLPLGHGDLPDPVFEAAIRGWFFFAAFFGVMGNGGSRRVRSYIVGTPYLYLGVFYVIRYINTGVSALLIPMVITLTLGVWLLTLGVLYELKRRSCGGTDNAVRDITNEFIH
jgi:hypothetical protein